MPIELTANKLGQAIQVAEDFIRPYRVKRREVMQQLVGAHYPGGPPTEGIPVNLISHSIQTIIPHLASHHPQYHARPRSIQLGMEALSLELMLADLAKDLDLVRVTQTVLLDALTGPCGIVKVGLRAGADLVKLGGRLYDPGQPYVQRIDLDDYVCDPTARSWDEIRWEGHRYRLPRQVALDSGIFDPEVIARIAPVEESRVREETDRLEDMAGDQFSRQRRNELLDMIELYDIALYDQGQTTLLTLQGDDPEAAAEFLRVQSWEGPQRGPYERLEFFPLSQQPLGLPFVASMIDMHHSIARVASKIVKQTENAKSLLLYQRNQDDTASRIAAAGDMDTVATDDPNGAAMINMGGAHPDVLGAYPVLWQFGQIGASLPDMLAGAADADTATEYQGNMAAASARIGHLASIHEAFQGRVASHLGFYLITDPLMDSTNIHRLPGGENIELQYTAETKRGNPADFLFEIRARSMMAMDPAVRARRFNEAMGLINTAAQTAMANLQMGANPLDLQAFGRVLAQMYDIPELAEIMLDPVSSATINRHLQARMASVSPPMPVRQAGIQDPQTFQVGQAQATSPLGATRNAREFANGSAGAA